MKKLTHKVLLLVVIICSSCLIVSAQKSTSIKVQYVCSPCGMSCDKEVFDAPGECPNCKMKLVDKKTVTHKSVSPTALSKFLQSTKNLQILDVRTKEEFEGHGEPDFGTLKNSSSCTVAFCKPACRDILPFTSSARKIFTLSLMCKSGPTPVVSNSFNFSTN